MKRLIISLMVIVFFCGVSYANGDRPNKKDSTKLPKGYILLKQAKEGEKDKVQRCPKWGIQENCTTCHLPELQGQVRETEFDAQYKYPVAGNEIRIRLDRGELIGYFYMDDISSTEIKDFFDYIHEKHPNIKRVVIELHCPGGSLLDAWRIVGLMSLWKERGLIIETRTHGFAMSAAFIVAVSGSKEYRFASSTAEFMQHELWTLTFLKYETPSDKEEEAAVLRHLQDTVNEYLASVTKLSKKEWDERMYKKEWWVNGKQAIKFGVVDGLPK